MKILIVEDMEDSRVYLRQALESAEHEIIESTNGVEAMIAAQQDPPDLIISDIMMPEMDGFELCLRVKNHEKLKHIPFIFYTATYLDTEDEELGLLLGASQYLAKPMDPQELFSAIKQIFEGLKSDDQMIPEALSSDEHKLLTKYFKTVNNKLTKRNLELVKKQEELERLSKEYVDLYDNAPDMYVSVSADSASILQCNETLLTNTGYSRDEVIGASIFKLCHDDCIDEVNQTFQEFVETGDVHDKELILKRKDGSRIDVSLNVNSIRDKSGKILHSAFSWRDITKRKQAELEIANALSGAEAANKVKDQFIANISHEIRTPLNSLVGFSDLFRQRYHDIIQVKDQKIFDYVTDSSNRLMHTVDSILNLSQIEAESITLHPEKIDLAAIAKVVIQSLKQVADEKNLELCYIEPKEPEFVLADEYTIYQALINLADNAIKYTTKGTVEIKLGSTNEQVTLSVIDTGIGISDEYQTRIFDPYTQESEGYTKQFQGVGLGMALVKKYLELNDVELELVSKKGVGSTFTLTFQRYEESASA